MRKKISLLLAAVLLCCVSAFAHNTPDLSQEGSIHVTMRCEEETVSGGTLTVYRVGDVQENYTFRLTEDFAESRAELGQLNAALAETLKDYANDQNLTGKTEEIGRDGRVEFAGLKVGLYLLVQEQAAPGYYKADPFLVTLPMTENGEYVYDVDASPKVEVKDKPSRPDRPTTPDKPEEPGEPTQPDEPETPPETPEGPETPTTEIPETPTPLDPTLPQTGQLNWPVPALAVLGMALLAIGFLVKRNSYEK